MARRLSEGEEAFCANSVNKVAGQAGKSSGNHARVAYSSTMLSCWIRVSLRVREEQLPWPALESGLLGPFPRYYRC